MSASKERGHGHGLEPEDVERLFPDHQVDYKRRAAGERDEEADDHVGDEDQQPPSISPGPVFDEPWPDPPIDDSAEVDADPAENPSETNVPLENSDPIKPIGYPQRPVRRLEPLPSSSTWFMELEKILE